MSEPYVLVNRASPHPHRARRVIAHHPEIKQLFGPNPWSAVCLIGIVALQLALSYTLMDTSWWLIVLTAYGIGAFANHALWVLVHECTHNLIFRNTAMNRWMAIIANLPMVVPATVNFAIYHIKHHKFLGDCEHDPDVAPPWEGQLLQGGFLGRLLWQMLFPLLLSVRAYAGSQQYKPSSWTGWVPINVVVQIAFVIVWFALLGGKTLLYLLLSSYFSVGPHPLGMRWIQEHYVFRDGQETYDYYGVLNLIAFNIGYHNEHHDLPYIAWNRLPVLKRLAPEMYDSLFAHSSWVRLWRRFLLDRDLALYRIARRSEQPESSTL